MFGQAIKAFVETSRELGSTKEETIERIIEKYRYQAMRQRYMWENIGADSGKYRLI